MLKSDLSFGHKVTAQSRINTDLRSYAKIVPERAKWGDFYCKTSEIINQIINMKYATGSFFNKF